MERVVNEPFSEPRDDSGFSLTCLYFSIFKFFFSLKNLKSFLALEQRECHFCLFVL